ncbi:hypothetical protein B1759_03505 [Rubrivirga sp. SAORIC476]|uniref:hypothetical protein n=1 Tax=Rubrivirga sp. SAORIC476 TaxID=1961794 RepID=UPI000BA94167|nr:hypothetical protein [Rubrivirga sp. SAORIC476]MAQ95178.1 hypothetical protein [Rhodothermaceae bacterium]MBC14608.1 hypothetical protein [Rhodothermaceae bacterium]PAP80466.1 hypothetical protein B1759_03505 [Rubrivirga sp. SAORIC476]
MGQQQLLLLVLGIVIVGLAVVVGIQAFGENQTKANADAMVNDGVRIASDAQAWKLKPQAFGGGGALVGEENFTGLSFAQLGYAEGTQTGCDTYGNLNGCYTLVATGTEVTITGTSAQGNIVTVIVDGTDPDDIATTVTNS